MSKYSVLKKADIKMCSNIAYIHFYNGHTLKNIDVTHNTATK